MPGIYGPVLVVQVECRHGRDQVHVGGVVGVQIPDVPPVATVRVAGAGHLVGREVVRRRVPAGDHVRHDAAPQVVHAGLVRGVGRDGVEQAPRGEDVVAH